MGSLPDDRTKTKGVITEESLKHFPKSKTGITIKGCPNFSWIKF